MAIMTEADYDRLIEQSDKATLWWGMYRLLNALHSARACDPVCVGVEGVSGGLYHVVHLTADHWGQLIPGMPTLEKVARDIAADDAYHATHTS
jgi:hypothetical protein